MHLQTTIALCLVISATKALPQIQNEDFEYGYFVKLENSQFVLVANIPRARYFKPVIAHG